MTHTYMTAHSPSDTVDTHIHDRSFSRLGTIKSGGVKQKLEKTEVAIKNGQSRETANIGYIRHKTKTNKNTTQYVLDTMHYTQIP